MHPNLPHRKHLQQSMPKGAEQHEAATNSGGFLYRWTRAVARNWQRRRMIAALEAMDDRLLRDIGINRGDIRRVVDEFDDRELRMAPLAPTATTVDKEYEAFRKAA